MTVVAHDEAQSLKERIFSAAIAVFPHGDGLSVGWWAPSADIALLGSIRH